MKYSLFRWLPVLLWAIFIFLTSANPNPYRPLAANWALPSVPANSDPGSVRLNPDELLGRFLHAAEYLLLAAFTARALVGRGDLRLVSLVIALGLSGLYAVSDEIHQLFVPGRAFELSDFALDLLGSAIGVIAYAILLAFWRRRMRLN